MYCRKCGTEIPDDSAFCLKCGTPVEVVAPQKNEAPAAEQKEEQSAINKAPVSSETIYNAPSRLAPVKKKKTGLIIICVVLAVALVLAGVYFFLLKGNNRGSIGKKSILEDKDKLAEVTASVLKLECYDDEGTVFTTGSGFIAFSNNMVITNYHVIEDHPYSIKALSEDGRKFEIEAIVTYNQEMDIAILKTKGSTGLTPLTFAEEAVEKTDKVVAIGSPLGLMNTVSEGIVSGFTQIGNESVIQFTASISHGSSGGVLLNEAGEVIGVTFATFSAGQNLNMAIPIKYVSDLYSREASRTPKSVLAFYNEVDHSKTYTIAEVKTNSSKHKNEGLYVYGYLIEGTHYYLISDTNVYNELMERFARSSEWLKRLREGKTTQEENQQENYNGLAISHLLQSDAVIEMSFDSYSLPAGFHDGAYIIVHGMLNSDGLLVVDAADYYN